MLSKINKKALGAVVATALIIVVAVVAVVGFQGWFQNYESQVFTNAETKSSTSNEIGIETIVGDSLYVKGGVNTSVYKILINGKECNFHGNITGIEKINVSDCVDGLNTSTPEIVVMTHDKVLSEKVYLKDVQDSFGSISIPEGPVVLTKGSISCPMATDKTGCEGNYIVDGCGSGTVLDIATNICWQRDFSTGGQRNWEAAKSYCNGLVLGGHSDWYLPSRQELFSIRDLERTSPAIVGGNNNKFLNVQNTYYWSISTYGLATSNAWNVNFGRGNADYYGKACNGYVVCAR